MASEFPVRVPSDADEFSEADERLLEAAAAGEGPRPLRDRALLELLYATGARISEATALDVELMRAAAAHLLGSVVMTFAGIGTVLWLRSLRG